MSPVPILKKSSENVYMEVKGMPAIFEKIDKFKPVYDMVYKIMMFVCKILLVADLAITCYVVIARYIPWISGASWTEEVILTLMSYMVVLSAALAIRREAHIRMTAFDVYLPKTLLNVLDVLADIAVLALAYIMVTVGWQYATTIGAKATYVSMPSVSKFWMYFPIPVAGVTMVIFQIEVMYNHIKNFWKKEEKKA